MKTFFSRRPRLTIALAAFVVLQIVLALWLLPEFARRLAVEQLAALVDAPVHIEDVDLNLFTRRAKVSELTIRSPADGRAILHLPAVELKFSLLPLFRGGVALRSLSFLGPSVFVERFEDGGLNVLAILRPQEEEGEPSGADFTIEQIEIRDGEIAFLDRRLAAPSERVLKNIHLKMGKISTSADLILTPTSFDLRLGIGSGTLGMDGSAVILATPGAIEASARWRNLDPGLAAPYLPAAYRFDFTPGSLSGEARYLLGYEGEKTVANVLTASVELGAFRLFEPEGSEPALAVAGLKLQDVRMDFMTRRLQAAEIDLSEPYLLVDRANDGAINLARFAAAPESAPEPDAVGEIPAEEQLPLRVDIQRAKLQEGTIEFRDHAVQPQVKTALTKLNLTLENLAFGSDAAPGRMEGDARLENGLLRLSGAVRPWPTALHLALEAEEIPFEPFRGYADSALAGAKTRGKTLGGRLQIAFAADPAADLSFELSGNVEAREPALELAGTAEIPVQAERLLVEFRRLRTIPALDVDIEMIRFDKAALQVKRDPRGNLNIEAIWKKPPDAAAASDPPPAGSAAPPSVTIRRLEIHQGMVSLQDRAVKPEVATEIRNLLLTLENLPLTAEAKPGPVRGEAIIGTAPLRINGSVHFEPLALDLALETKGLAISSFRGYIEPGLGGWETRGGALSGSARIAWGPARDGDAPLRASGKVEGNDLVLGLRGLSEPPFKAKKLTVELARLATVPALELEVGQVDLVGAELRVERNESGELNLKRPAASARPGESKETPPAQSERSDSRIVIGGLKIDQSRIEFVDRSIEPTFGTNLADIAAEMGKAGVPGSRAPISLKAKLDESAALELKGWFTPLQKPLRVELEGKIVDYDLAQLNPYATKFIRYEVKRGRVTTDVEYSYDEGDLAGENEITIRHLQLGEQLGKEFEQQVGISLKLALALLEDLDGRIRLRVPVRGDVGSPDFTIGGVVWRALRNALIKFLAAPFSLLGKVLTVGGKITEIRVDPVSFAAGTATLGAEGKKQVSQLADFLKNKPRLEVEIRGAAAQAETDVMKRQKMKQKIKAKPAESYEQALLRIYRSAGGAVVEGKTPPVETMETYLARKQHVADEELIELAEAREKAVADALIQSGVERGRVFESGDVRILKSEDTGRAEFELLY